MPYKIPSKLLNHIKKILTDEPLDIYFEESESFSTSVIELVNPRQSKYGKMVGSANMLIASSILNFELVEEGVQKEYFSDEFTQIWTNLIESFKDEGFLKDTPEAVREGIYLAVDNEVPDLGLKTHSCLNKGENTHECNNE